MSVDTEKIVATPTTTTNTSNSVSANNNNNENEHLLEHKWVLWFRPPANHHGGQSKSWENSQKIRFTAESVESFWRGFKRTQRITKNHPVNCDYSLFREGITPAWEDEWNENGGRWTYNVERRHSQAMNMSIPELIETIWLDVMLCLIGEGFDPYGESIAGGVCGIRSSRAGGGKGVGEMTGAKIHIWTKDAGDTEANMAIGKILKECVNAPDGTLSFAPHDREGPKRSNHGSLKITL